MKKRFIVLLLTAALALSCLSGCGSKPAEVEITVEPTPEATEAPAETPEPTPEASEATDAPDEDALPAKYAVAYAKHAPDEVAMLVDGTEKITWQKYYSWISEIASHMEQTNPIEDWSVSCGGYNPYAADMSCSEYVCDLAVTYLAQVATIGKKAREAGITLTQEQEDSLTATIEAYWDQFGGEEAFEEFLAAHYMSSDYLLEENRATLLLNGLYEDTFGAGGSKMSDEDAISYLKDNGYLYAKHILFKTVDDSRQPLSDEAIAQKRAEAEAVLAELRECAVEELPEKFDALMKQYSEDTGMLAYPDGYYFRSGEMVKNFETAVSELEENGLSELVETEYGFHIIFCPPMSTEHIIGYDASYMPYYAKSVASTALFDKIVRDWFSQAIEGTLYRPGFDRIDLNELFAE